MRYTETVLDHFLNPRNIGPFNGADAAGTIGSAECGDQIRVWIRVQNDRLVDVRQQVFGCPAAVAACSMMTELATGLSLEQAGRLQDDDVARALGGLPPQQYHCSNLAASALHNAIENYRTGQLAAGRPVVITALVNNVMPAPLQSEHGLSFWIEYGGQHILFDAGASDLLVQNAAMLNIDLAQTDTIVISHGHYDHTGGIRAVLELAPNTAVYLHPNAARRRYSCYIGKPPKDISIPMVVCEKIAESVPKGRVFYTDKPTSIYPGMLVTGPIPRVTDYEDTGGPFFLEPEAQTPDNLEDDQALIISRGRESIVVLGCAHAGAVNTLQYAVTVFSQPVSAVIGGMHLRDANENRLSNTLAYLNTCRLRLIAPCHCTGDQTLGTLRGQSADTFHDFGQESALAIP